jgi:hypothetical protein
MLKIKISNDVASSVRGKNRRTNNDDSSGQRTFPQTIRMTSSLRDVEITVMKTFNEAF